jgi:aminopeptidase YwaD
MRQQVASILRAWRMVVRIAIGVMAGCLWTTGLPVFAQKPPLLRERDAAALANELSGETAKRNLEGIARFHRQRGSAGFHSAAELVAERLRAYGLRDVAILQFPADGKIFYGTQRSRPGWDAEVGELEELPTEPKRETIEDSTGTAPASADRYEDHPLRLASYEAEPVVLAEDSESAQVTAQLLDVGEGTKDSSYEGKDVKGKIVLVAAQPGAVQDLAIGKYGAVGIISYAQNQKTAWSGENENLIRWGHLETFSASKTFAFMVSLKTARSLQARIAAGEKIKLRATVKAGQHAGNYEVVTATIPGADAKLQEEEIAFSCHLDHQRPGANDNASGCVTILEVARTLEKLIDEKKLPRPSRTMRFIFPPEVEGTMALLNARPEFAARIKAVIHMDMVGGGAETKAVFHVTRGPMSLPSLVHDVAWAFAEWVNEESYKFAATGSAEYPMVAPEGGQEPLRAEYSAFSMGSDHEVYQDSSFGIPAIYLNDWPDRYIHTNFDTAANIDTTKLLRAGFIGAASGYFLADNFSKYSDALADAVRRGALRRSDVAAGHNASRPPASNAEYEYCAYEAQIDQALRKLSGRSREESGKEAQHQGKCFTSYPPFEPHEPVTPEAVTFLFRRKTQIRGPLTVFAYDYFADHAKTSGLAIPKLLSYEGLWGTGEEYAYEILNFANGERSQRSIWSAVSAEYGPVPFQWVVEYLEALEKIGVLEKSKPDRF